MTSVDLALALLVLLMAALVVVGVVAGARQAAPAEGLALRLGLSLAVVLAAWLALTAGLALGGVLATTNSVPPRVALLPLGVLASMVALSRTKVFSRLVEATPRHWPIALQAFRVPVELLLWALFLSGRIPERMTFSGRNFDVLIGLSAPLVAWAVFGGRLGRVAIGAWNVLGLILLANIVNLALRSAPGPLDAGWGGVPNTAITAFPFVWLPAFLVPLAVFGHVVALKQLARPSFSAPGSDRGGMKSA